MKAIKIVDEDRIEKFCKLLPPYENYEENHAAIMHGNRLGLELQPFYTASDMPADDDLPSFSDGDWDDDRDDDFEGQRQESDGSFVLD